MLQTFLAGHPMLMSMTSAPAATLNAAASAIWAGSLPAICTACGRSLAARATRWRVFALACRRVSLEIISEAA